MPCACFKPQRNRAKGEERWVDHRTGNQLLRTLEQQTSIQTYEEE